MAVCGLPAALEGLVPEGGAAPRLPSIQGPLGPPSGHRVLGSRWPLPQMTKLRPAEARGLQVAGGGGRGCPGPRGGRGARGPGAFAFVLTSLFSLHSLPRSIYYFILENVPGVISIRATSLSFLYCAFLY